MKSDDRIIRVLEVNVDDQNTGGVFSLVRNVIRRNPSNVIIDIAAIERFQNQENIDYFRSVGTEVHFIGFEGNKMAKQIKVYLNLKRLLKEKRYDYVHIHADTANKLLVSGLAAKHAGVSVIFHSHSSGIDGSNRRVKMLLHRICRRGLKSIGSQFVACSDYAAEWMYPGVDYVTIINNGVELDHFRFDSDTRTRIRESLNYKNEIVAGHVGRFLYQKNHEYLIHIMKKVKENNLNIKMLLVGEGDQKERIEQLSKEMNVDDRILFYGIADNVNELMQAMDIFLLPSHFEGLPIVGVEAQAAGLPVIFSNEITPDARLIDNVIFLPIDSDSLNDWVNGIVGMTIGGTMVDRERANDQIRDKKFDLKDTIDGFLRLYTAGGDQK